MLMQHFYQMSGVSVILLSNVFYLTFLFLPNVMANTHLPLAFSSLSFGSYH